MKRAVTILVATMLAVSMIAAVPLGAALPEQDEEADDGDDIRPGERLGGVVGVQEAEIDGEIESRSFGIKTAQDRTDDARSDAVAEQLERNEQRLTELQQRQQELREQRDAGEITNGTYRAKMAETVAETENVKRTTNARANVSAELPDEMLEERGVDAEKIRTLQERANELSGPEVAEIARGIAGERVGAPMGPDRADRAGPDRPDRDQRPADADNASAALEAAEDRLAEADAIVADAEERVSETDGDERAEAALERAQSNVENAESTLADARAALEAGDDQRAVELTQRVDEHASDAVDDAEEAIERIEEQTDDDRPQDRGDSDRENRGQ